MSLKAKARQQPGEVVGWGIEMACEVPLSISTYMLICLLLWLAPLDLLLDGLKMLPRSWKACVTISIIPKV